LTVHQLRRYLLEKFGESGLERLPSLNVVSFGYKFGIPLDADLVFDVRFLPNPYFERNLRHRDGNDPKVEKFLRKHKETGEFLDRIFSLLTYLIPQYAAEGKNYLTIAIGCTGGRHRSVMVSNAIAGNIKEQGRSVKVVHRDVENE